MAETTKKDEEKKPEPRVDLQKANIYIIKTLIDALANKEATLEFRVSIKDGVIKEVISHTQQGITIG